MNLCLFFFSGSLLLYRTPLYMACVSGHAQVVQYLIELVSDPSLAVCFEFMIGISLPFKINWSTLHRATLWSHTPVMKLLIKAGVEVNGEDEDAVGFQAFCRSLHLAAKWAHFEAAEILLASGADVSPVNDSVF
jgi:ankyrin repeat protein